MTRFLFLTLPMALIGIIMFLDIALNAANVVGRYAFGSPIFWAEEVMVYLSIWGVFIGIIPVAFKGEHLCMDLFTAGLVGSWYRGLHLIITLVLAVCCLYVAAQSLQVVRMFADTGAVTTAAGIPKAVPHFALLLGFGLTAVAAIVRIRSFFFELAEASPLTESMNS